MQVVNIRLLKLKTSIQRLKNLKTSCENWDTKYPETVGGGQTVGELEEMAKLYKSINESFTEMVSNTALFMENIKNSFEESDKKASNIFDVLDDVITGPAHTGNNHNPENLASEFIKDAVAGENGYHTGNNHKPENPASEFIKDVIDDIIN